MSAIKKYSVEQLLDYMDCPLCYHIKHVEGRRPPEHVAYQQKNRIFKEAMQETIAFYYRKHLERNPPTLKQLYDKFYQAWLLKTNTVGEESIFTRKVEDAVKKEREDTSRYVTRGYQNLRLFYQQNSEIKQSIIAIHHPYELVMGDAIITGTIPLIREVASKYNKRTIELGSFSLSYKKPAIENLITDIRYTIAAFAYQNVMKSTPDRVYVNHLMSGEDFPLVYGANDYKRLLAIIEGFTQSVGRVTPHPRPGGHLIKNDYQLLCDNYYYN